jgi:hypothetical protein
MLTKISRYCPFNVAAPTGVPLLSVLPPSPLRAGSTVHVSCERQGGQPRPTLALSLAGETLSLAGEGEATSERVTYAFEAKPAHHGALLACSALNSVMAAPAVAALQLDVLCKFLNDFSWADIVKTQRSFLHCLRI